ncbi:conserved hypothetical protein [Streptomyces sp. Mg1]|nr:conserved hypothetical protein [Streptomyces sp. Mg1]
MAMSFPRLLRVDGRDLHVTDLDAVNGSPIYDLGPYFEQMGPEALLPPRPGRQSCWRTIGPAAQRPE